MDMWPDWLGSTFNNPGGGSTGMMYKPKPIRIILKSFAEIRKKKKSTIEIKTEPKSVDD